VDDTDEPLHRDEGRQEPGLSSTSPEDETERTAPIDEPRQTDDCSTFYTQPTAVMLTRPESSRPRPNIWDLPDQDEDQDHHSLVSRPVETEISLETLTSLTAHVQVSSEHEAAGCRLDLEVRLVQKYLCPEAVSEAKRRNRSIYLNLSRPRTDH